MGMGRKEKQRRQEELWIAHTDLPRTVGHPFYEQLNRLLEERGFDEYVEQQCARFYAAKMGRPSLAPGRYFGLLLIGRGKGAGTARRTRLQLGTLGRKRARKGSNGDWVNPHDPEAQITKMKDGRTHLAYRAEHAVDLQTGAVVAVTLGGGDAGDTV